MKRRGIWRLEAGEVHRARRGPQRVVEVHMRKRRRRLCIEGDRPVSPLCYNCRRLQRNVLVNGSAPIRY
eukprot:5137599-Pyramimonas_sp.AAC.1